MKKVLLLMLLVCGFANAQIVNIPDANFKAKLLSSLASNTVAGDINLNSYKIDINSDNEIQVSEALLVGKIDVSNSNITDLTGIEQFVNLKHLICNDNQIANLNLSNFFDLTKLYCSNNLITSLNLIGLSNIEQVRCSSNLLTSLDASGFVNLFILDCAFNQISNLSLSGLVNLSFLDCKGNQLSSLDLSGLTSLEMLFCGLNQFSNLDVNGLLALKELYCNNNQISTLNLTGLTNLTKLTISNNLFTDINLTGLNLKRLDCKNNLLTILNLAGISTLEFLSCGNNQLQTLELNEFVNLGQIFCSNNVLTSLFVKNGKNESILSFSGNPDLQFICADESQISSIQTQLTNLGMTATVSNTYCSFTPGGDYNTITGSMIFDSNNNGCDATDLPQPNIKININDGTNQGATFTNNSGNYSFFTQAGSFNLTPDVENPSYFNLSPANATINFPAVDNSVSTNNFCITANGVHPDVEIVIAPIVPARPGFDAVYKIVYKNKGNQTLSGNLSFEFNEAVLDLISSVPMQDNTLSGSLGYNYTNLMPFENRQILITLNVNGPMETPAVNIDDVLNFTASVVVPSDETPTDNTFVFSQTVVGSYDPNDKQCIEGDILAPDEIGEYLHYLIRFENTGTAPAENIVVKDIIDTTMFDVSSLRVMNSSHPVEARVTGNVAEFIFKNINLDTNGHGNILLKVKTNATLNVGDVVKNKADIFFDYNFPIITNEASTLFQDLGIEEHNMDTSVTVYPNPTEDVVHIKADSNIQSIRVFDVQGRLLMTRLSEQTSENIDLSNYATGIYYLNITTEKGSKTEKTIKK